MHRGRVLTHALGVVLLLAQHRDHRLGAGDHLPRREVRLGDGDRREVCHFEHLCTPRWAGVPKPPRNVIRAVVELSATSRRRQRALA